METNSSSNNDLDFSQLFDNDLNALENGQVTRAYLNKVFDLIFEFLKKTVDRSEKVTNFHHPHELNSLIDLSLFNNHEPVNLEFLLSLCKSILNNVVKTGHPRFFNQLYQGLDIISLIGEWLTATTNTNLHTYEAGPVYVLMENHVIQKLSDLIGWKNQFDGLFTPGGAISNLYAMLVARHYYFRSVKTDGLFGMPKLTVFISKDHHYSTKKTAAVLGIGTKQVKEVPVDEKGKIIPNELEKMIQKSLEDNEVPFMVAITAGTTVLGAFDPIHPVADICEKYKLWLHVDAAWGGGALLSHKHRHLFNGIERADSVAWCLHKMMGSLLQSSAFLVKKPGLLLECNSMSASYLFQQDKFYDVSYDIGDKTIQCGRHVDVFKVWLMWKAKGDKGLEENVNKLFELAKYLHDEIKKRENFELVMENPEFTNVCFWYIPPSLQLLDKTSEEYRSKLDKIAPIIKGKMLIAGTIMIAYQPLDKHPNFFRIVLSNPITEFNDMDFVLDEIHRLGKDL